MLLTESFLVNWNICAGDRGSSPPDRAISCVMNRKRLASSRLSQQAHAGTCADWHETARETQYFTVLRQHIYDVSAVMCLSMWASMWARLSIWHMPARATQYFTSCTWPTLAQANVTNTTLIIRNAGHVMRSWYGVTKITVQPGSL